MGKDIVMEQLNYAVLRKKQPLAFTLPDAPERILQFGEGGFMRGFVDAFVDEINEKTDFCGKVVVCQPRGGHPEISEAFTRQEGLYTLILRGRENGQKVSRTRVISCISRCLDPKSQWQEVLACAENPALRFIISNTTEAGIIFDPGCRLNDAPPTSYPAKLLCFLYRRYQLGLNGFWILPCELNDHNGTLLQTTLEQYCDLWQLEDGFRQWFHEQNTICSTLVDRIVTGFPMAEFDELCHSLGYRDDLLDTAEVFGSWVIEAPYKLLDELPLQKAGLPVILTTDHTPYKQRKVRILNGGHTSMVLGAYLAGKDIVRDCMGDSTIRSFMNRCIYDEIIPTLNLPAEDLKSFAASVLDRFDNPYIDHSLLAISLNSTAKWRSRVLPTVQDYYAIKGVLPPCLVAGFAFYVAFYHHAQECGEECLFAHHSGRTYEIKDDSYVLDFFFHHRFDAPRELVHALVNDDKLWGDALRQLPGFEEAVVNILTDIQEKGTYAVMKECI